MIIVLISVSALSAAVINVPQESATIQAGITLANDGDTVLVDVGTYVENVNFNGKNILVKSLGGPELTIIDGNQNGSAVMMTSGETSQAVLDGFTITNGSGWYNENISEYIGGGICVRFASSPILKNLIVAGNAAVIGASPAGGGIAIGMSSHPVLQNVIITDNTSMYGGGLSIAYDSDPILRDVEISYNTAITGGGGGGVYIGDEASPYFEKVYIHHNVAPAAGGFFLHAGAAPTLNKVTVTSNTGNNGGGAMVTNDGSIPVIVNSNVYGNFPDQFYLMYADQGNQPDTVTIAYSNVQGGLTGIHLGIGQVNWVTGNMQTNPILMDGDHLNPISPCIDAGTALFTYEEVNYVNMTSDEYIGSVPDMGSWEMPEPQALLVPQNYTSIQLGIEAAVDGDTVLVADGTYLENIDFLGKNIVVKSVNGELVTSIDGGALDATVKIMNQEATAVLDGFTITNGSGVLNLEGHHLGGGIACRYTSTPTLRNLIVEHNDAIGDTAMGGGIICSHNADAIIEDVIIRNNEADYGGGFVAFEANPSLTRVKIYENYGRVTGGGLVLWTSDAHVEQTTIVQNEAEYVGAGVWVHLGGHPTLDRVTIADNNTNKFVAWGAKGAGIGISDGSSLELTSSIVWGNTNRETNSNNIEFYHIHATNSITINYSDIEGGQADILTHNNGTITWTPDNITDDPMFVDCEGVAYALQPESPCIGTGYLGVDMGAGSECVPVAVDPDLALLPQQFELYQNYPNPFNPSTTINFELPGAGWVNLVIYDVTGREVATLIDEQGLGGRHSMNWIANNQQGKLLATGIYLYEMKFTDSQGKQFHEVRKFTLLK